MTTSHRSHRTALLFVTIASLGAACGGTTTTESTAGPGTTATGAGGAGGAATTTTTTTGAGGATTTTTTTTGAGGEGGAGGAAGGAPPCAAGTADCNADPTDGCETPLGTATDCAACGDGCARAHAAGTCAGGACALGACDAGWGDCNGAPGDGCEAALSDDPANCGGCDAACPAPAHAEVACLQGVCGLVDCVPGFDDCDGDPGNGCEADLLHDTATCGACGAPCSAVAHATTACASGQCAIGACDGAFVDCDGDFGTGCESDPATDAKNCGACGKACAGGESCVGGACAPLSGCAAIHAAFPALPSGVYTIAPGGKPVQVYCDMTTDGGGWTYAAIVTTTTDTADRTRMPGLTAFGAPGADPLGSEYSADVTGLTFKEIRIDNFTAKSVVKAGVAGGATWDATTYKSDFAHPAKRVQLDEGKDFRIGYYPSMCPTESIDIPMCFTSSGNPLGWVCDTDSGFAEGMLDETAGEMCGAGFYYCKKVWHDAACTSYAGGQAVYGFALR